MRCVKYVYIYYKFIYIYVCIVNALNDNVKENELGYCLSINYYI